MMTIGQCSSRKLGNTVYIRLRHCSNKTKATSAIRYKFLTVFHPFTPNIPFHLWQHCHEKVEQLHPTTV